MKNMKIRMCKKRKMMLKKEENRGLQKKKNDFLGKERKKQTNKNYLTDRKKYIYIYSVVAIKKEPSSNLDYSR